MHKKHNAVNHQPFPNLFEALGKHINNILPENKPTKEALSAARSMATLTNSTVSAAKVTIECARLAGRVADLSFLHLPSVGIKAVSEKA